MTMPFYLKPEHVAMQSLGCGDRVVKATSVEEGMAIVSMLDRLDHERERREHLEKTDYGHEFGHNRRCEKCGMLLKEFRSVRRDDRRICDGL